MTSGVEAAAVPGDATSNEQVQQGHHLENVDHAQPAELANVWILHVCKTVGPEVLLLTAM